MRDSDPPPLRLPKPLSHACSPDRTSLRQNLPHPTHLPGPPHLTHPTHLPGPPHPTHLPGPPHLTQPKKDPKRQTQARPARRNTRSSQISATHSRCNIELEDHCSSIALGIVIGFFIISLFCLGTAAALPEDSLFDEFSSPLSEDRTFRLNLTHALNLLETVLPTEVPTTKNLEIWQQPALQQEIKRTREFASAFSTFSQFRLTATKLIKALDWQTISASAVVSCLEHTRTPKACHSSLRDFAAAITHMKETARHTRNVFHRTVLSPSTFPTHTASTMESAQQSKKKRGVQFGDIQMRGIAVETEIAEIAEMRNTAKKSNTGK